MKSTPFARESFDDHAFVLGLPVDLLCAAELTARGHFCFGSLWVIKSQKTGFLFYLFHLIIF